MIIMAFAHARISGDASVLERHVRAVRRVHILSTEPTLTQYTLLRKWTDYLVNNTLELPSEYVPQLYTHSSFR